MSRGRLRAASFFAGTAAQPPALSEMLPCGKRLISCAELLFSMAREHKKGKAYKRLSESIGCSCARHEVGHMTPRMDTSQPLQDGIQRASSTASAACRFQRPKVAGKFLYLGQEK